MNYIIHFISFIWLQVKSVVRCEHQNSWKMGCSFFPCFGVTESLNSSLDSQPCLDLARRYLAANGYLRALVGTFHACLHKLFPPSLPNTLFDLDWCRSVWPSYKTLTNIFLVSVIGLGRLLQLTGPVRFSLWGCLQEMQQARQQNQ